MERSTANEDRLADLHASAEQLKCIDYNMVEEGRVDQESDVEFMVD